MYRNGYFYVAAYFTIERDEYYAFFFDPNMFIKIWYSSNRVYIILSTDSQLGNILNQMWHDAGMSEVVAKSYSYRSVPGGLEFPPDSQNTT